MRPWAPLKAWQACRPVGLDIIERKLRSEVLLSAKAFQTKMGELGVGNIHDAIRYYPAETLYEMSVAVGRVSYAKVSGANPMVGSKIMHFLFPEFFPVWDTAWIKQTALSQEEIGDSDLANWLSKSMIKRFGVFDYCDAAITYGRYVALMMKDLDKTTWRDYKALKQAYIRYSEIPNDIFEWHFADLAPILFEVCLLGKHNSEGSYNFHFEKTTA